MNDPYIILGLEEDAPEPLVEGAYRELMDGLDPERFTDVKAAQQAAQAKAKISEAFKILSSPESKEAYQKQRGQKEARAAQADGRPRLGQLCVASGMISMEQLEEAVETQMTRGIPLGEVLQEKQFISQAELDGLLLGQEMIDVPTICFDPLGQRLIALGLISQDMALIIQMEQKTLSQGFDEIVARHGWVDRRILDALLSVVRK